VSVSENPVRIRAARPYDAAALLDLKHRLDEETAFMMYEPEPTRRPQTRTRSYQHRQSASKSRERVRKWAVGERWTPEMRDAQQAAIRELAHARKRFADTLAPGSVYPKWTCPPR
jgi:hypothetical protein